MTTNNLDWKDDSRNESLSSVYDELVTSVDNNIQWYTNRAKREKRRAQWIRVLALCLLGLGTIIPVIIDLTGNRIPASLATLVLALGSGLLAFDRFMGYSTGWMRFLLTEMLLKAKLEAFRFQWIIDCARRKDGLLSDDELINTLQRFAAFRAEVSKIVQDETQLWVQEFQSNLASLDENFQSAIEMTQSGSLSVVVSGLKHYPGGWDLMMDNEFIDSSTQSSIVVDDVTSGFRKLTAVGKDAAGNPLDEVTEVVTVTPGSHLRIELALPAREAADTKP